MRLRSCFFNWRRWAWLALASVLAVLVARQLTQPLWDEPVVTLKLGETYDYLHKHSTAPFSPLIRGHIWGGMPKTDARMRFVDSQYGFETPLARFLSVGFNDNVIDDVRMSPQVEPLLIDDAMKVVLDLQAQWCATGWKPMGLPRRPTMADTPEWRAYLKPGERAGVSYWQAGDRYQAMLILGRFEDSRHPDQERYLITLELSKPWRFGDMEHVDEVPHPFPPPQPKQGAIPCQPPLS